MLLGEAATGKSSLLVRFTTGEFASCIESTIGAAFKSKYDFHFEECISNCVEY